MIVTIYKLDNPAREWTWWKGEFTIDKEEQLFLLDGVVGENVYYDVVYSKDDSQALKDKASKRISLYQTKNAKEMIDCLMEIVSWRTIIRIGS